jgi:hypothetical protein
MNAVPRHRHGRACPGHPRLVVLAWDALAAIPPEEDVDGRDKPGHDGGVAANHFVGKPDTARGSS